MDEIKVVPAISQTVPIVANNLRESLNESPNFMQMDYAVNTMSSVFFGFDKGVMVINSKAKVSPDVLKNKMAVQDAYFSFLTNKPDGLEKVMNFAKGMQKFIKLANCCCSPCSVRPANKKRRAELKRIFEHKN